MAQAGSSLTWIIVLAVALLLALITVLMQFAMPKFRIMQKLVDRLNLVSREILTRHYAHPCIQPRTARGSTL